MKKLVETEMDGKAASEQVLKLRDVVRILKQVRAHDAIFHVVLQTLEIAPCDDPCDITSYLGPLF